MCPSSDRDSSIGSLAGGRFALIDRLGAGAFGVVYRARDTKLDQVVALKMLHKINPAAIYRFKREFRSLAEIRHENLVYLYELFAEGDEWFFTMELVEGCSFLDHLGPTVRTKGAAEWAYADTMMQHAQPAAGAGDDKTAAAPAHPARTPEVGGARPSLDPTYLERLLAVMQQVCSGVAALHDEGMLHRDLKPSNVRVAASGEAKILDFGLIAAAHGPKHHEDGFVGTPLYMSPEQAVARPDLSAASDWYSVGVMIYEALVGKPPFAGIASLLELLQAKQTICPPHPSDHLDGIPDALDKLCVQLLHRDPEARPDRDAIVRGLSSSARSPRGRRRAHPSLRTRSRSGVLVGRRRELELLDDAFNAVQARGEPVFCLLQGLSGVGKTSLLEAFLGSLAAGSALPIVGRCYQQESVAYKAWDMVVDALAQHLMRMERVDQARIMPRFAASLPRIFPVLGQVSGMAADQAEPEQPLAAHELRWRAFTAFRDLMSRLSEHHRLVIVLDDLQWSDVDSTELIGELLRNPDAPPLLLVGSFRSDEVETSPALRSLLELHVENPQISAPRMIAVDVLPFDDARAFARQLFAHETAADDKAEIIARESGGNPMFVRELARAVGTGEEVTGAVQLDDVIRRRASALSDDPRALLETIAAAGEPLRLEVAERAAGLSDIQRSAGELLVAQFIRVRTTATGETIEPYHARVAESVVAGLTDECKRTLHGRLAAVLEEDGSSDFEGLASHFFLAGMSANGWHYTRLAADEALGSLAFERAARLYRSLVEGSDANETEMVALKRALAEALASSGRYDEAVPFFEAVLQFHRSASPDGRLRIAWTAVSSLLVLGYRLYLHLGRRHPSPEDSDLLRVRHQTTLSLVYVDPMKMFLQSLILQRHLCRFDLHQLPAGREMWCFVSAVMSFSGFSFRLSKRILERCAAGSDEDGTRQLLDYRFSELVFNLAAGHWTDIAAPDPEWIERHLANGRLWHVSSYLLYYALFLIGQDRFEEAEEIIHKLRSAADEHGYQNVAGAYGRFLAVNVMVRTRRLEGHEADVDAALDFHVRVGMAGPQILFHAARARLFIQKADLPAASEALTRAEEIIADQSPVPPHYTAVYMLVRVELAQRRLQEAITAGDRVARSRARKVAVVALRQALRNAGKYAFARTETFVLAGAHHALLGRKRRARAWFGRAVAEARRLGSPLDEARGHVGLARLVLESSEADGGPAISEAEASLARARTVFESLDARWDLVQLTKIG